MRKRKKLATGIWITSLSAAFAPSAGAVPLTFEFGGVIDFVEQGLPISSQIAVGTPYGAVYQFDPEGVKDVVDLPTLGGYQFGSAGFMTVDIGALTVSVSDLTILIENSTLLDLYQVGNGSPFIAHGATWLEMELDLRDLTLTALDSDALPLTAPDLDDFQFSQRFAMRQVDHRFPSVTGTVTYLNMIPEPSSMTTLFAAAVMISLRRRHPDRPENLAPPTR